METWFWAGIATVVYTYVGYGLILWLLVKIKHIVVQKTEHCHQEWPAVTLVIAAYNEERFIDDKIVNSLAQTYPGKLDIMFVTDGSDDTTPARIAAFNNNTNRRIILEHQASRKGKIAAVNRIMPLIDSPIVVYTDANTTLNPEAIERIVACFANPKVGAVSGEKRIFASEKAEASGAGEGLYWKYESALKRLDSELYSVVGAAGELFAIRRELFEVIPEDTIVEDFYTTMRIAQKGYKVAYEPQAYASEGHSASVAEELKRKIRIAAGGMQAISRLLPLLNPFRYGLLSFQYISHRVLRWTLAPLALPLVFILNYFLYILSGGIYTFFWYAQIAFYTAAIVGYLLGRRQLRLKILFVPYYFCMMNYALYRGFFRFLRGRQSVVWERAARA